MTDWLNLMWEDTQMMETLYIRGWCKEMARTHNAELIERADILLGQVVWKAAELVNRTSNTSTRTISLVRELAK